VEILTNLLEVFGRLHPLLLHLPIGILLGVGILELVFWKRGMAPTSRWLLLIAAISAVVVAGSGWILHEEDGYASSFVLRWHERLGMATAVGASLCCLLRFFLNTKHYRICLLLTVGVMLPAGHFGAEMTHGKGFLLEPFEQTNSPEYVPVVFPSIENSSQPLLASFGEHIAPLLQARCTKCHGARKSKGELRLDSSEAILLGGENGAIITFEGLGEGGERSVLLEQSEMYRRLLLPLDHDDHMPPESKTQLSAAEIDLLRMWLQANAPFEEGFSLGAGIALPEVIRVDKSTPESHGENAYEDQADDADFQLALQKLHNHQVHVQPMEPGSKLLWVDFSAIAETTDDPLVADLLQGVKEHVHDLSLARTQITNDIVLVLAKLPNLSKLDLGQTAIADAGLASLRNHVKLKRLILSQTLVTSESYAILESLPALTHLWLWDSAISMEAVDELRKLLPNVVIDAGESFQTTPLEVEPDLVFTNEPVLMPINRLCPVTGKPIDSRYSVVQEEHIVGFCCPNCPKKFWEDPAAYPIEEVER